jgi:hypothetical protein
MRFPLFLLKRVLEEESTNRLYGPFHFLLVVFGSVTTQGPRRGLALFLPLKRAERIPLYMSKEPVAVNSDESFQKQAVAQSIPRAHLM